jgi:hypothetical protein
MADCARNQHGLGKAVTFNVLTPMTRWGALVVGVLLWVLDRFEGTQKTAKQLAFLFEHVQRPVGPLHRGLRRRALFAARLGLVLEHRLSLRQARWTAERLCPPQSNPI